MRVIAGTAKRRKLITLDGTDTRPTTDRIKETLFNILTPDLYGCHFLDLFAGSGGIGIEALSRGAEEAVFIEKNPKAAACIKENLRHTGLEEKGAVIQMDVFGALKRLEGDRRFDFVFMDPPYRNDVEREVLVCLAGLQLLSEDGLIIIEAAKETPFSYVEDLGFEIVKEKTYKTNKHIFLNRRKGEC